MKRKELFSKYLEDNYKRRGYIIDKTISLESVIEQYIANYFTGNNKVIKTEFIDWFFWKPQTGFTRKREVFEYLVKTYDKELLELYPSIIADIDEIIRYRNNLAHREIDFSGGVFNRFSSGKFGFKNRRSQKVEEYDDEEIERIANLALQYTTILMYWWLDLNGHPDSNQSP